MDKHYAGELVEWNIEVLLSKFADVTTTKDGWLATCPAHPDTHPSLRLAVTPAGKMLVRCRAGCGTGAVLKALDLRWGHLEDLDTTGRTYRGSDTPATRDQCLALAGAMDPWQVAYPGSPAEQYAHDRFGVTPALAGRWALGYAATPTPRLVVPFCDPTGWIVGYQARALGEHAIRWMGPKNPDGASWSKLAFFPANGGGKGPVMICEGPGDALAAAVDGYDAIGIRGAALADSCLDTLKDWTYGRDLLLAGDGDDAGRRFNRSLLRAFPTAHIYPIPEGKDYTSARGMEPAVPVAPVPVRLTGVTVSRPVTGRISVRMPYAPNNGNLLRAITPGATWDRTEREWTLPRSSLVRLLRWLAFEAPDSVLRTEHVASQRCVAACWSARPDTAHICVCSCGGDGHAAGQPAVVSSNNPDVGYLNDRFWKERSITDVRT